MVVSEGLPRMWDHLPESLKYLNAPNHMLNTRPLWGSQRFNSTEFPCFSLTSTGSSCIWKPMCQQSLPMKASQRPGNRSSIVIYTENLIQSEAFQTPHGWALSGSRFLAGSNEHTSQHPKLGPTVTGKIVEFPDSLRSWHTPCTTRASLSKPDLAGIWPC